MSERYSGNEPASQEELCELKELAAAYVMNAGSYYDEGGRVVDERGGLSVITGSNPDYTVELPLEKIQELVPPAIDALGLSGALRVSFFPPHYSEDSGELVYQPGHTIFHVGKPPDHSLNYEALIITDNGEKGMGTDRIADAKRVGSPKTRGTGDEAKKLLVNFIEGMKLADDTGLNRISKNEVRALSDIIHAFKNDQ